MLKYLNKTCEHGLACHSAQLGSKLGSAQVGSRLGPGRLGLARYDFIWGSTQLVLAQLVALCAARFGSAQLWLGARLRWGW